MNLKLVVPTKMYENEWYSIVKEFEDAGEEITPYSLKANANDYSNYLRITKDISNGVNLNGLVQADTFFLVDGKDAYILGAINIRYELNDYLFNFGGNIGYGIRPSERRKGYASQILELALIICGAKGLEKVLVTCDKDNIGSAKTIINNGAILENEVQEGNKVVQRYWIML